MTTLMTTTLPTVVGMGVISETTKVMFGQRGKKRITKTSRKRTVQSCKIHRGSRGGKYVIRKGQKIYI